MFGNQNIALDTALYHKNVLCVVFPTNLLLQQTIHSPLQKTNKFGLGFSINPENLKGIGDELMDWYNNLDVMDINHKRESYLETM